MSETLIEAVNLKKYFSTNAGVVHAVDDVSFKINAGETLGVVGESGCGKSTLGRALIRLYDPTEGKILYRGEDIAAMGKEKFRKVQKQMQMIFQDPYSSINPHFSVGETVLDPLRVSKTITDKNKRMAKVTETMELCGLPERYFNTYPHELDGGRRQRVGLARALVLDPEFIVCDEPISALDVSIQSQVVNMLEDMQEQMGLTYLFIAHDLSVVRHISNRIGVMYLGSLVELGESYELNRHPIHPYTQTLLSAVPVPDPKLSRTRKRIILEGDVPSPMNPPSGCRFHTRCPYATEKCSQVTPVFREHEPGHWAACHLLDK